MTKNGPIFYKLNNSPNNHGTPPTFSTTLIPNLVLVVRSDSMLSHEIRENIGQKYPT
jgi:hypothetical protein